jgi:hypothetical protein
MCKKSEKRDKAKIREILAPHLLQRFLAKLSPVVKSELKISDFVGCFYTSNQKNLYIPVNVKTFSKIRTPPAYLQVIQI